MLETIPVSHLPFQLRVTEPVSLLEYEELHHHWIHVWSSSSRSFVGVYGLDDWCEGFPVDQFFDLG